VSSAKVLQGDTVLKEQPSAGAAQAADMPINAPQVAVPVPTSGAGGDSRQLVLSAAIGYRPDQVRVFVESLRASGFRGEVIILSGIQQFRLRNFLRRYGVRTLSLWHKRSFFRPVTARRFQRYYKYLLVHRDEFDHVMIADVRDVVFQSHPFEGMADDKCHYFLERNGVNLANHAMNWGWLTGLYGAEADVVAHRPISCAGITLGPTNAMLRYLGRMAAEIDKRHWRIYRTVGHGYDQGLHNFLIHTDPELAGVLEQNNGHVATMQLEPRQAYKLDDSGLIRTHADRVIPICHQYDRFPDIRGVVERRWSARAPSALMPPAL
jgi:hypothetical protein